MELNTCLDTLDFHPRKVTLRLGAVGIRKVARQGLMSLPLSDEQVIWRVQVGLHCVCPGRQCYMSIVRRFLEIIERYRERERC